MGIPPCKQLLTHVGNVLQEEYKLKEYDIGRDSTIYLNTRLRGGYFGKSSKGLVSFKDAVKGKMGPQIQSEQQAMTPGAYIIKQTTQKPTLSIVIA